MTGKFTRRAAATAAGGCVALTLTGCGSPLSDQAVALSRVRDAVVVSGTASRPATEGEKLRKGDRVHTGAHGTVTLTVRGRRVVLGGATDVTVPDGASLDLARGAVLVDRRRGPGLTLRAGDATVDSVGTGALRVERTFAVLVASLSATARVSVRAGATVRLPRLYQVGVAGRAVAGTAAPLQLRDDAWERSVIPKVVADDVHLNDLAAGIDSGPTVALAAYRPSPGVRPSDEVLADAIARAARADAREARSLRAQGGSWGVVSALLDTSATDVASTLSDVLGTGPATVGPTPTTGTTGGVVAGRSPDPGVGGPTPSRTPDPTTSGGPKPPPTNGGSSPTPTTPPPTSSLIDDIGHIIESPLPSPLLGVL